ncbi:MAG: hypothetical protein CSA83_01145 [Actinomycetales bacterium]|nr:MAG: hypothetical protein CSA83_01145 [Actinomycetales bacterium]
MTISVEGESVSSSLLVEYDKEKYLTKGLDLTQIRRWLILATADNGGAHLDHKIGYLTVLEDI